MSRSILAVVTLACGLAGCIAELGGPDQGWPSALLQPDEDQQQAAPVNTDISTGQSVSVTGAVSGAGQYQIFDLGPTAVGEAWAVGPSSAGYSAGPFTLVLLDDQYNLLMRRIVSRQVQLDHITRHATEHLFLGVTPSATSPGGAFNLLVEWENGLAAPAPAQQTVYLNFDGAAGVRVHGRNAVTLPSFDASSISPNYAGATEDMAAEITRTIRLDYAPYDILILSSLEGPPPEDAYCTMVYFGGSDDTLLGLADNVDMYNSEKRQIAVVYIDSFSPYSFMGLDEEEMALMIGNVGSHELGHLLGLYHTEDPDELMDSSGSAWDLAQNQSFGRAPLQSSVFPTGMQNAPQLLEQTLGANPSPAPASAKLLSAAKIAQRARMRDFTRSEISHRCGLCLNPDDIGGE